MQLLNPERMKITIVGINAHFAHIYIYSIHLSDDKRNVITNSFR